MSNAPEFSGQTVLVTGAATGIGKATALAFGRAGATLVLGDVDESVADTAKLVEDVGGVAHWQLCDVQDPQAVRNIVRKVDQVSGKLDIAFNNAGIVPPHQRLADTSDEEWQKVIGIDLSGVFYCLREEINYMKTTGGGSII